MRAAPLYHAVMRRLTWLGLAAVFVAAVALWWAHGLQSWLAIKTGTRCGSTGEPYCYWSGFGSVWPWSLFVFGPLITAGLLIWRHHTCQYRWWCWRRPVHPLEGHEHILLCSHHHPDHEPISVDKAIEHHIRLRRKREAPA